MLIENIAARRLFSIREIVSTERTYADSLQLLHRAFVEQAPIPEEEKKQLFAPMDPLREWHVGFALKLEARAHGFFLC